MKGKVTKNMKRAAAVTYAIVLGLAWGAWIVKPNALQPTTVLECHSVVVPLAPAKFAVREPAALRFCAPAPPTFY